MSGIDYSKEIKKLRELSDTRLGGKIIHQEDEEGNVPIIRDMRQAIGNCPRLEENYLIQALNILRATEVLLEISECDGENNFKKQIGEIAKPVIALSNKKDLTEDKSFQALKEVNSKALKILKKAGVGKSLEEGEEKLLNVAKNFTGLENDHHDVMTILPLQDKEKNYYVQRSEKLCQLTDFQKKQYEDLDNQDWFKSLQKYEQLLVEKYRDKITDGKHLIPTQIRNIPGVRNGYKTTICTVNDERKVQDNYLYSWTHSGTIAAFTGNDELNKNMSSENLEQLSSGASLHVLTLNTKSSFDKECVKQTDEAVKKSESNIKSSNIPINIFRALFKGNYEEIALRLNDISCAIKDDQPDISCIKLHNSKLKKTSECLEINSKGGFSEARKELDDEEYKDIREFLKAAIELKQLLNKYSGILGKIRIFFAGSCNASLEIGRKLVEFEQGLTELKSDRRVNQYLDLSQIKEERIHFACKSGKDRTGLVNFVAALDVIKLNLSNMRSEQETTETSAKKSEKEIAEKLAEAGHFQYLAGNFGGTPGCVGLKPLPFSIPKSLGREVSSALQLKTAWFNNSIPKPSFFSRSVIQEKSSLSNKLSTPLTWMKDKLNNLRGVTVMSAKAAVPSESEIDWLVANDLGITEESSFLLKYWHQLKTHLSQTTEKSDRGDFHSEDSDEKVSADDRNNLRYDIPFQESIEENRIIKGKGLESEDEGYSSDDNSKNHVKNHVTRVEKENSRGEARRLR